MGSPLRLGNLIDGKMLARVRWKLSDSTFAEDIFRHRNRRRGIRPAGVEREMRDDLRKFAWLDPIIERQVEMVGHLDRLITGDQGRDGDNAAVSWR
jgi:hypothetical protein